MGEDEAVAAPVNELRVPLAPFDLRRTFTMQALGAFDPTAVFASDTVFIKNFISRGSVVTLRCEARDGELVVTGDAGALTAWGQWLPPDDGAAAFAPSNEKLAQLHRRLAGLRLLRVPWVFDVACGAVLQQRIAFVDAVKQFGRIAKAFGARVGEGAAFPDGPTLAKVPLYELQRLGVDAQRARTLHALAKSEAQRPFLSADTSFDEIVRRLELLPGIGPWTMGMIRGYGLGDSDATIVGDLGLPHLVCWALAGEPRGTDERMLELLEPFRGHRFRVTRLLHAAGISVPRG